MVGSIKIDLIADCKQLILAKIDTANEAIQLAEEALLSDTKSSAGDKFETGREMAQQEISRTKRILLESQHQLFQIKQLEAAVTPAPKVQAGSLIITNQGMFFLGVSLGMVLSNTNQVMVISTVSPMGKILLGKKVGEGFDFLHKNFQILEIH
ncbi:MAG: 3-oxoacyl-ACP synthase [Pedobacter sp.]|nr:MAG: 3-oxoacyl-ACP synthase [Pedobacter sp.]